MRIIASPSDFTTSLEKALSDADPKWRELNGLIIPGTHEFQDVDAKLAAIKDARENGTPTLGECGGLQLMAVEYARNVLCLDGASSTEINPDTFHPIVIENPKGLRVGIYPVDGRHESFWHRFSFNPRYLSSFMADWSMVVSGDIVVEMRLAGHPFFMGTQYHSSYQSSSINPHPLLIEFLNVCRIANTIGK